MTYFYRYSNICTFQRACLEFFISHLWQENLHCNRFKYFMMKCQTECLFRWNDSNTFALNLFEMAKCGKREKNDQICLLNWIQMPKINFLAN